MKTNRGRSGLVLGAASGLLVGWGIYHMMLIGSCSTPPGPGEVACPPEVIQYILALIGGVFVGVAAAAASNGLGVFAIFGGIGLGGILAGLQPASGGGQGWYVFFGACFLLTPMLGLLSLPFVGLRRLRAARLMQEGIPATGTVLEVAHTGVTINSNPRLRMRFRIEPNDGYPAPFEAEKVATVPRVSLPRAGDRYPVWIDRDDHAKWMFAAGTGGTDATSSPTLRRVLELARHGAGPAMPPAPATDVVGDLGRLNALRLSGTITADEFAARTSDLINAAPTA
jgi:hypothetical protein